MTDTINDGGPAFPCTEHCDDGQFYTDHFGVSMRDYFAANADVAVYAPVNAFVRAKGKQPTIAELAAYITEIRYIEADAMLAAREVKHD